MTYSASDFVCEWPADNVPSCKGPQTFRTDSCPGPTLSFFPSDDDITLNSDVWSDDVPVDRNRTQSTNVNDLFHGLASLPGPALPTISPPKLCRIPSTSTQNAYIWCCSVGCIWSCSFLNTHQELYWQIKWNYRVMGGVDVACSHAKAFRFTNSFADLKRATCFHPTLPWISLSQRYCQKA